MYVKNHQCKLWIMLPGQCPSALIKWPYVINFNSDIGARVDQGSIHTHAHVEFSLKLLRVEHHFNWSNCARDELQDYRATKRPSIYLGHLDSGSLQNHFKMDFPERLIFDGMNIPPFRPLKENVEKRFTEIRNLECRKDDIILATYNKSGNLSLLVLYNTMETTYYMFYHINWRCNR